MRYFRVRIDSDDPRLVARDGRTASDPSPTRPALSSFRDLAMVAPTTDRGVDGVVEALLDADSNVPEPELGAVLSEGDVVGYTVGDDVSGRDIEGQNPLYLRRTNVFERCCAVGPCVASPETAENPHELEKLPVLPTGTSIVPPSEFTLREDDRVEIAIENAGTLTNTVTTV